MNLLPKQTTKTLPFSANLHVWIQTMECELDKKYRIQKLVLTALLQGSRKFRFTKKEFERFLESTNRRTKSNFLTDMEQQGIISLLKQDHFKLEFELAKELFEGEPMEDSQLDIKDDYLCNFQFRQMPKKSTTDQYEQEISELLSEVTDKKSLERMALNVTLRDSFVTRLKSIKNKIASYEKRNSIKLETARANLVSISRILKSIKVFNPEAKTYEDLKKTNKLSMSPRDLVIHFYRQLSIKLQRLVTVEVWPSEIEAAKDVIKQFPDKDAHFIKAYINWVIHRQHGIQKMYNTRYFVAQYFQVLNDEKHWEELWSKYSKKPANYDGIIIPQDQEELECLFVHLYEKTFQIKYKPANLYEKDIHLIKNLITYMNDNLEQTIELLIWAFQVVPKRKEKLTNPGDLYRLIKEFKGLLAVGYEKEKSAKQKEIEEVQFLLKRAKARRIGKFILGKEEKEILIKLFTKIQLSDLDQETQKLAQTHHDFIYDLTAKEVLV